MTRDDRDNERGKRPFVKRGGAQNEGGSERPRRFEGEGRGKPRQFEPRGDRPRGFDMTGEAEGERIAKRLARAGIASRREAESMIAAGRVAVNGKVLTSPAVNVQRSDKITVDNKVLQQAERTRLWLYHKPAGLVTTNRDPEGRPTVFDSLPAELPRVLSVGRLDINTEGLLLLTNDGGLSRILELPATGWLRRYRVRAHGSVTQAQLDELKNGIAVDGVFYGSVEAVLEREQGANVWLTVGLREGKNREVKNILGALGLAVSRLIRVSFGPFQLGDLEEGAVREIRGRTLREQLGEKLVEDSGADFDAPILNEFSNEAVKGELPSRGQRFDAYEDRQSDDEEEGRQRYKSDWISSSRNASGGRGAKGGARTPRGDDRGSRGENRGARSEGRGEDRADFGERKPFRRERDGFDKRADGLARLSTSAPKGGRFGGKGRDEADAAPAQRPRGVNVWMAPGAKPFNKPAAKRNSDESRDNGRGGYKRQGFRRDEDNRDGFKREGFRSENRRQYEEGDRPAREERRFSGERGADKKAFGDKKPYGERSSGDKSFRGKSEGGRGGKPAGGRSYGKPSGGKPSGNRPSGPRGSGPRSGGNRGDKR